MIAAVLFAAIVGSMAGSSAQLSPLPFAFRLEEARRAAFDDPATRKSPDGVSVLVRSSGTDQDRVDVFQERRDEFPRWEWIDGAVADAGAARLVATAARSSLIVWRRPGAPGYRVSDVIRWPAEASVLELSAAPARLLAGSDPAASRGGTLRLLSSKSGRNPLCEANGAGRWQCIAVASDLNAVLTVCSPGNEVRFAEVRPRGTSETTLQADGWAAGVLLDDSMGKPDPPSPVTFSLVSPGGAGGQTTHTTTLPAVALGDSLYWVHGPLAAEAHLLARRGSGTGRTMIDELAGKACGDPVRLVLQPARIVHGSVVDGSGKPLPGASILALEPRRPVTGQDPPRGPILVTSTKADDHGDYFFIDLAPYVKRLRACHARTGCLEKDLPASAEVLDFSLSPKWRFTGRAVSQSGVPIGDAHLRFVPLPDQYARASDRLLLIPPETDAVADPAGLFEISPPAPASYYLEARAAGTGTARRRVDVTALSPARTDLGDLVLSGAGEFLARLVGPGCSGGSLSLVGPIDVGTPAAMREFALENDVARIEFPEGGTWLVQARCADGARFVVPDVLPAVQDLYGQEVRFSLGERVHAPATPPAGKSQ